MGRGGALCHAVPCAYAPLQCTLRCALRGCFVDWLLGRRQVDDCLPPCLDCKPTYLLPLAGCKSSKSRQCDPPQTCAKLLQLLFYHPPSSCPVTPSPARPPIRDFPYPLPFVHPLFPFYSTGQVHVCLSAMLPGCLNVEREEGNSEEEGKRGRVEERMCVFCFLIFSFR